MGVEPGEPNADQDPVLRELMEGRQRADRARAEERVERDRRLALARELTELFWASGQGIPAALRAIHALVTLDRIPARTLAQRAVRDLIVRSLASQDLEALRAFGEAANLAAGGDPGSMTPNELREWFRNSPGPPRHQDGEPYSEEERSLALAYDHWLPSIIAQRAGLEWANGEFRVPAFLTKRYLIPTQYGIDAIEHLAHTPSEEGWEASEQVARLISTYQDAAYDDRDYDRRLWEVVLGWEKRNQDTPPLNVGAVYGNWERLAGHEIDYRFNLAMASQKQFWARWPLTQDDRSAIEAVVPKPDLLRLASAAETVASGSGRLDNNWFAGIRHWKLANADKFPNVVAFLEGPTAHLCGEKALAAGISRILTHAHTLVQLQSAEMSGSGLGAEANAVELLSLALSQWPGCHPAVRDDLASIRLIAASMVAMCRSLALGAEDADRDVMPCLIHAVDTLMLDFADRPWARKLSPHPSQAFKEYVGNSNYVMLQRADSPTGRAYLDEAETWWRDLTFLLSASSASQNQTDQNAAGAPSLAASVRQDVKPGEPRDRTPDPAALLNPRAQAVALLATYPNWSMKQIATAVGVARTTLYSWPAFMAARRELHPRVGGARGSRRGFKNTESGEFEAWDEDTPAPSELANG